MMARTMTTTRTRSRPLKTIRLSLGALVLLALVIFLLSNRVPVSVAFFPFGTLGSAVLGAIVLIAFGLGVLLGMLIHLPRRMRAQRRAKRAERQLAAMQAQPPAQAAPAEATISLPPAA
ncbi:MAG: hypothetical protein B7Z59_01600 [Acidiphilium sp. 37-67-22]|nr:MAG: hypothetical protein B7Z59_01600 [Acidiphilium sp. 37-67-22]